MPSIIRTTDDLAAALAEQRAAFHALPYPDAAWRVDRIKRVSALTKNYADRFVEAVDSDFGGRPAIQTKMELFGVIEAAKLNVKNVRKWMRAEKISLPLPHKLNGAKAEVFRQPLGVIGMIGPWNFPFTLLLGPLCGALAAGNRVLFKPSDMTPATGEVIAEAVAEYFDADEVATALGGLELAQAFSGLPFDHLLFTGSPAVAHPVMRAAAEHLVPVTLELGGKCPVVLDQTTDMDAMMPRLMMGKLQNAGQICLAPDTVFVRDDQVEPFVAKARECTQAWYPTITGNADYCAIINDRNFARVQGYVDEAKAKGARVEELGVPGTAGGNDRRLMPAIVVNPADDLGISRDEIFGPVMQLKTYQKVEDIIDWLAPKERPLALYYLGKDSATARRLQRETVTGGFNQGDLVVQAAIEELPLGGVGNSGMGSYHGKAGFDTFSHAKSSFKQGRFSALQLFKPPYTERQHGIVRKLLGA